MQLSLGLLVEASVAILLAVTIGYCVILNRRLKKLHSDKDMLRKMVLDLVQATDLANSAIRELKTTALEADTTIAMRLDEAERFGVELKGHVAAGRELVDRIAKITNAAARAAPVADPIAGTEKVQSALQQLAMRPRMRGNAA